MMVRLKPVLLRVFLLFSPLYLILILEMILRVGAFVWYDQSRYYLFYGFHTLTGRIGIKSTDTGQHYKFPPRYLLRGAAGQADETAAINALGYRGPDFEPVKPAGTFRVICMGESSTFGFHNRDTQTYPFLLQKLFDEQPGAVRVEVINAGFPYYNTGSMLSLLQAEVLGFQPDILTLYNGYNDAGWPLHIGPIHGLTSWLQDHSMTYLAMKKTILPDALIIKWQGRISRRLGGGSTREGFEANTAKVVARYRQNMKAIISAARSRGVRVILVKQPMTSRFNEIQVGYARTYEEEYRQMLQKLNETGELSTVEFQLLAHHRVVTELEALAKEENLEIVDNVALVDRNRRVMASYVHLTAEGNLVLARALKEAIERHLPTPAQTVVTGHDDRHLPTGADGSAAGR